MIASPCNMTGMTLTPAYGRDYTSAKAAKADFDAEKDFILQSFNGSGLINKQQIAKGTHVQIRFKQQRNVTVVKV